MLVDEIKEKKQTYKTKGTGQLRKEPKRNQDLTFIRHSIPGTSH